MFILFSSDLILDLCKIASLFCCVLFCFCQIIINLCVLSDENPQKKY